MTKALRKYPESERKAVAQRRVQSNTKGLGYWAAIDFLKKEEKKQAEKK